MDLNIVCEELPKPTSTEDADGDKQRPLCKWGRDVPRPLLGRAGRVVTGWRGREHVTLLSGSGTHCETQTQVMKTFKLNFYIVASNLASNDGTVLLIFQQS